MTAVSEAPAVVQPAVILTAEPLPAAATNVDVEESGTPEKKESRRVSDATAGLAVHDGMRREWNFTLTYTHQAARLRLQCSPQWEYTFVETNTTGNSSTTQPTTTTNNTTNTNSSAVPLSHLGRDLAQCPMIAVLKYRDLSAVVTGRRSRPTRTTPASTTNASARAEESTVTIATTTTAAVENTPQVVNDDRSLAETATTNITVSATKHNHDEDEDNDGWWLEKAKNVEVFFTHMNSEKTLAQYCKDCIKDILQSDPHVIAIDGDTALTRLRLGQKLACPYSLGGQRSFHFYYTRRNPLELSEETCYVIGTMLRTRGYLVKVCCADAAELSGYLSTLFLPYFCNATKCMLDVDVVYRAVGNALLASQQERYGELAYEDRDAAIAFTMPMHVLRVRPDFSPLKTVGVGSISCMTLELDTYEQLVEDVLVAELTGMPRYRVDKVVLCLDVEDVARMGYPGILSIEQYSEIKTRRLLEVFTDARVIGVPTTVPLGQRTGRSRTITVFYEPLQSVVKAMLVSTLVGNYGVTALYMTKLGGGVFDTHLYLYQQLLNSVHYLHAQYSQARREFSRYAVANVRLLEPDLARAYNNTNNSNAVAATEHAVTEQSEEHETTTTGNLLDTALTNTTNTNTMTSARAATLAQHVKMMRLANDGKPVFSTRGDGGAAAEEAGHTVVYVSVPAEEGGLGRDHRPSIDLVTSPAANGARRPSSILTARQGESEQTTEGNNNNNNERESIQPVTTLEKTQSPTTQRTQPRRVSVQFAATPHDTIITTPNAELGPGWEALSTHSESIVSVGSIARFQHSDDDAEEAAVVDTSKMSQVEKPGAEVVAQTARDVEAGKDNEEKNVIVMDGEINVEVGRGQSEQRASSAHLSSATREEAAASQSQQGKVEPVTSTAAGPESSQTYGKHTTDSTTAVRPSTMPERTNEAAAASMNELQQDVNNVEAVSTGAVDAEAVRRTAMAEEVRLALAGGGEEAGVYYGPSLRDVYLRCCDLQRCRPNSYLLSRLPTDARLTASVEEIDLSANYVGHAGFVAVLDLLAYLPQLQRVYFNDMALDNVDAENLCAVLAQHPSLTVLQVKNNPKITLPATRYFTLLLRQNHALRELGLEGTKLGAGVIAKLQAEAQQPRQHTLPPRVRMYPERRPYTSAVSHTGYCDKPRRTLPLPPSEALRILNAAVGYDVPPSVQQQLANRGPAGSLRLPALRNGSRGSGLQGSLVDGRAVPLTQPGRTELVPDVERSAEDAMRAARLENPFEHASNNYHASQQGVLNAELRLKVEKLLQNWQKSLTQMQKLVSQSSAEGTGVNAATTEAMKNYLKAYRCTEDLQVSQNKLIADLKLSISTADLSEVAAVPTVLLDNIRRSLDTLLNSAYLLAPLDQYVESLKVFDAIAAVPSAANAARQQQPRITSGPNGADVMTFDDPNNENNNEEEEPAAQQQQEEEEEISPSNTAAALHERFHYHPGDYAERELNKTEGPLLAMEARVLEAKQRKENAIDATNPAEALRSLHAQVDFSNDLLLMNKARMQLVTMHGEDVQEMRANVLRAIEAAKQIGETLMQRVLHFQPRVQKDTAAVHDDITASREALRALEQKEVEAEADMRATMKEIEQKENGMWREVMALMDKLQESANAKVQLAQQRLAQREQRAKQYSTVYEILQAEERHMEDLARCAEVLQTWEQAGQVYGKYVDAFIPKLLKHLNTIEEEDADLANREAQDYVRRFEMFTYGAEEARAKRAVQTDRMRLLQRQLELNERCVAETLDPAGAQHMQRYAEADKELEEVQVYLEYIRNIEDDRRAEVEPVLQRVMAYNRGMQEQARLQAAEVPLRLSDNNNNAENAAQQQEEEENVKAAAAAHKTGSMTASMDGREDNAEGEAAVMATVAHPLVAARKIGIAHEEMYIEKQRQLVDTELSAAEAKAAGIRRTKAELKLLEEKYENAEYIKQLLDGRPATAA